MFAPHPAMPQTVTMPVFGSSTAPSGPPADGGEPGADWHMESGGDGMDFDMLAEYLLDDNPENHTGLNFDFNGDSSNAPPAVSPEQSVDGAVHTMPGNGAIRAQQIITQHVVTMQQPMQQPMQKPMQQPMQQPQQPVIHHTQSTVPAPAPTPLAPAPTYQNAPIVAAQGITLSHAPTQTAYSHPQTHIAPAPGGVYQGGIQSGVTQQPTTAVTKRRRTDVPVATAVGSSPAAPVLSDPMAVAAALQGRGRKKTQAQIDRRRERNRILARRTRLRKKFFFESLQKEVIDLQRENSALKDIVKTQLSEDGQQLLNDCTATENLPAAVLEACGEHASDIDQQDFNLVRSIQQSQHSFIITDPSLQDNPIVFASDDFLNLTGYSREDVLGRNCRFLQGTETSQAKVEAIRKGISEGEDVSVTLVNYTAEGTPFWNKLFIAALRDAQNNIVNCIGVIAKVPGPEPTDPEYGKVLPGEVFDDENEENEDDQMDSSAAAMVADGTVKAIEGAVDAAVAAAPSVVQS